MNSDEWTIADDSGRRALAPGTQVASYRIEAPLGEGGMATVYRAIDTKLNRPVAIKFLRDTLADAAARRRFQREAQMASSLNHPHILTVYDVGEFGERQYLVTEFVDGGTVKHWAHAEKRSWMEIVELLTGVADGLAAAHGAGILHRDIKPANVLVAKNGYAKLADFGLAKLFDKRPPSDETQTMGDVQTRAGVIVGTIAYMSPEQASGKPLDHRSDIFSFGVLLYELLAGRRPFGGNTELEVLKTVIHGTPEPLAGDVPPPLRLTVEKALEKDPEERYQSMRDVVVDLRRVARQGSPGGSQSYMVKSRALWLPWAVVGMVTAIVLAVGFWFYLRGTADPQNPLEGATYTQITDYVGDETGAALSPDGKWVLFVSDKDGGNNVWLERVGADTPLNLSQGKYSPHSRTNRDGGFTGDGSEVWLAGPPPPTDRLGLIQLTGGPLRPFLDDKAVTVEWSRDRARLLFFRNTNGDPLFVADRDGTNPQQIYIASAGVHNHFPAWSVDGKWIYFVHGEVVNFRFDLWRIAAAGGQPEQLTHHNSYVGYPTPIDARTVLYVAEDQDGGPWLFALDVDRKTTRRISAALDRYTSLSASADGRRLVASVAHPSATLWSVSIFDNRIAAESDVTQFSVPNVRALSPRFAGTTLFYLSSQGGSDGLWRRDRDGQVSEIWKGLQGAILQTPAISWDGKQAAVVVRNGGKQNLRVMTSDGSVSRLLAEGLDVRGSAAWSPDGTSIVTGGDDGQGPGLFKIPLNGGLAARLTAGPAFSPVWSPKGDLIVYRGANTGVQGSLVFLRQAAGSGNIPPIQVSGENASFRFSPDGKSLIYTSNSAGSLDFWMLDLGTQKTRQLARLNNPATMHAFDITRDGTQIVFDRVRENSDIVLIDLKKP